MLVDQMSSLLDDTSAFEPWTLTGPEIREVLDAAARVKTGIDAFISSLAGAADGMGLPKEDGGTSTTARMRQATSLVRSTPPDFWSENGPTDLDNAALFCHFHHSLLHEGQWTARMAADGIIEVIPPQRVDPHQKPRRHARFTRQQPRPG